MRRYYSQLFTNIISLLLLPSIFKAARMAFLCKHRSPRSFRGNLNNQSFRVFYFKTTGYAEFNNKQCAFVP
ncbi:hypothetical protein KsCSTR_18820 [Candidatus Kuenenia stuttgartiensis]|uniref:Uncharacterized protein n=1 Tax=Kuenenia stuttgartiensis TaxID=174633 RepID=Q1Q2E0_KUEST|nr:hypothetical protein KsCSTR_18820 [Candidatus Kuenenia stuttgartiensis]CAJ74170.1 unknown protein [Candidatus Kuenenia stuttgartiensis]